VIRIALAALVVVATATPAAAQKPRHGVVLGLGLGAQVTSSVEGGVTSSVWIGWLARRDLAITGRGDFHDLGPTESGDYQERRQLGLAARWWPSPAVRRIYLEAHLADDRYAAATVRHGLGLGATLGLETLAARHLAIDLRLGLEVTTLDAYVDRNQVFLGAAITYY
jgi:hypothetical protein